MDVLWRDRGPESAGNNLNQVVYVTRRALAASVISVREGMLELLADSDGDLRMAAAEARHTHTRVLTAAAQDSDSRARPPPRTATSEVP